MISEAELRRHAVAAGVDTTVQDLDYDIHQLVGQDVSLAAKGLPPNSVSAAGLTQRRAIFEVDWERRLAHLLPPQQPVTFAAAWQSVVKLVTALQAPDTAPHR